MMKKNNLPKFSKELSTEPNILGFPGLFVRVGAHHDIKQVSRTASQERREGDVSITEQVTISRTDHGFPNVTDLSVLFYIFDLYATQGFPDSIEVSIRGIADFLGCDYGQTMRKLVLACLDRLGSASFLWQSKFRTPTNSNTILERFSLLSYRHSVSEQFQAFDGVGSPNESSLKRIDKTYVTLAPQIANNLRIGFSIPIDLESFRSLKLDLAKQLYSWACSRLRLEPDDQMKSCRIPSKQLFHDLSIDGARYKKVSNRRDMLSAAIEQIHLKTVPQGHIEAILHESEQDVEIEISIRRPQIIITKNTLSAYDLVGIFLEVWGRTNVEPKGTEINAAQDVLASFPLEYEAARKILETIHRECKRNNYTPNFFNGIMLNLQQHLRVPPPTDLKGEVSRLAAKRAKKEKPRPIQANHQTPTPSILLLAQLEEEYIHLIENLGRDEAQRIGLEEFERIIQSLQNEYLSGHQSKSFERMGKTEFREYTELRALRKLGEAKAVPFDEFVKNAQK